MQDVIDIYDFNFNCYVIPNTVEVTECGKKFDLTTYIYGFDLDSFNKDLMCRTYPVEGTNYEVWGKMQAGIFQGLIHCLKHSNIVKKKYIRMLNA